MNIDTLDYIIKRLLIGLMIVMAVMVLLFVAMQMMPGDPIRLICGPRVTPERVELLRHQWGLDKPAYMQFFFWFGNLLKGNLGNSISTGQEVSFLINSRLPYTLLLTGSALLLEYIIAVPLGLIAALKKGTKLDDNLVLTNMMLFSMPTIWLPLILIIVFSIQLKWFPISGFNGISSLVLPVSTLVLTSMAWTFGLTRSEVIEASTQKYVLTAEAKGLSAKRVMIYHVLRNSLIPITIMFFLFLPWLIGGSVIIENIFGWPGMGRLMMKAISAQDYPVVQAITLIITILTVISNIIGDVIAAILDPRIRLE